MDIGSLDDGFIDREVFNCLGFFLQTLTYL